MKKHPITPPSPDFVATLNPIRYRGYYYDSDLGLYYLQSRYYDANIGRFISADEYVSTGIGIAGYNMFAYCNNCPIITKDENGNLLCTVMGAAIGALTSVVFKSMETDDPEELKAAAIGGAVSGAFSGFAADLTICTGGSALFIVGVTAGLGALGSFAGTIVESKCANPKEEIPWADVAVNTISSGLVSAAFGAMSPAVAPLTESIVKAGGEVCAKTFANAYVKEVTKDIGVSIFSEFASNFFSWLYALPFTSR